MTSNHQIYTKMILYGLRFVDDSVTENPKLVVFIVAKDQIVQMTMRIS